MKANVAYEAVDGSTANRHAGAGLAPDPHLLYGANVSPLSKHRQALTEKLLPALDPDASAPEVFVSLLDLLDHRPGQRPPPTDIGRRLSLLSGGAVNQDLARDMADESSTFRAFLKLACARRLSVKTLLAAHRMLCPERNDSGQLRSGGVCQIRCPHTGVTVRVAPDAHRVPALMSDLILYLETAVGQPSDAFVAALQLALIHPYADGNGRVARVMFAALCWRWQYFDPSLPLAMLLLHRSQSVCYLAALTAAHRRGDWRSALGHCGKALALAAACCRDQASGAPNLPETNLEQRVHVMLRRAGI